MPLVITDGIGTTTGVPAPALPPRSSVVGASQSATDFGLDFDFLNGLNPAFPLVGGYSNLGQALAHRLETPRGGLFYDPDYGTDLRGYLNAGFTPSLVASIQGAIQSECLKDERVQVCTAAVSVDSSTSTMTVTLNVITADGPFPFVLSVTAASVALINSQFHG